MTISRLYQRAHALRMEDKRAGREAAPSEFYLGRALCEHITDMKKANGEILMNRDVEIRMVKKVLQHLAHKPEALRRALLGRLRWPEPWAQVWQRLLRTYGEQPRLLLAIADGMEA
jgi:hypothetical protein